jgi:hypothetical protein
MSKPISDPVFDIGRDLQRAYDEGYKQGRYDEKVETETSSPSGEQTHALRAETHAYDLISRNAALALVVKAIHGTDSEEIKDYLFGGLRKELWALPSAQPERKRGEWIPYLPERLRYKCSECESKYDTPWHFCPNCGSYNGGEQSEND